MVTRRTPWAVCSLLGCVLEFAFGALPILVLAAASGCDFTLMGLAPAGLDREILPETVISPPADSDNTLTPAAFDDKVLALSVRAEPVYCCDPLAVEFTAEHGDPLLERKLRYSWNFGDGRSATGKSVRHTYPWAGEYLVIVTAQLQDGGTFNTQRALKLSVDDSGRLDAELDSVEPAIEDDDPFVDSRPDSPDDEFMLEVNAGQDQTVDSKAWVTLQGSFTVESGVQPELRWEQVAGPTVPLIDADNVSVSFRAPQSFENLLLSFRFTATAKDQSASDDVNLVIRGSNERPRTNQPPTVSAQTIRIQAGQSTTLTLTGTDPDGDDLNFSITAPPASGFLAPVESTGPGSATVVYVSRPDFSGTDLFLFYADDGLARSSIARFTIQVEAPDAVIQLTDAAFLVPVDRAVDLKLEAGGRADAPVTFDIVNRPRRGSLGAVRQTSPRTAVVRYTPHSGFQGTDALELQARSEAGSSNTATITLAIEPLMVPWVEINYPHMRALNLYTTEQGALPGMNLVDYCLAGIESWAQVTDTILVTTRIENVDALYPTLMARKPAHVRIIGGVKTDNLPGVLDTDPRAYDFTDPTEWARITDGLRRVAQHTNQNTVLLENETALYPFHVDGATIDYERLAEALAPLTESGLVTWTWLPMVFLNNSSQPTRFEETTRFVTAFAKALPENVFFNFQTAWNGWENSESRHRTRQAMEALLGPEHVTDGMYVTKSGWMAPPDGPRRCYTPSEGIENLRRLQKPKAWMYPGASNWVLVGREMAQLLPPLGDTATEE